MNFFRFLYSSYKDWLMKNHHHQLKTWMYIDIESPGPATSEFCYICKICNKLFKEVK